MTQQPPRAWSRNGRVFVPLNIPPDLAATIIARVPGARRSPKVYHFPATPACCRTLDVVAECRLDFDDTIRELIDDGLGDIPQYEPKTEMWGHQRDAWAFVMPRRAALLHMGMGTGKTKVSIDIIAARGHRRVLVVCPRAVIPVWFREFEKHCPVPFLVADTVKGSVANRMRSIGAQWKGATEVGIEVDVAVVNYEVLQNKGAVESIKELRPDLIIADEIHRIKSPGGVQSRAMYDLRFSVQHVIGLTGTPLAHDLLDAYGQFRFLDVGIFGSSFARFRSRYAYLQPMPNGGHIVTGFHDTADFNARFYTITHRVPRSVLKLREPVVVDRTFDMPPASRKIYDRLKNDLVVRIKEHTVTASNVLVELLRLHQIGCGFFVSDDGVTEELDTEKIDLMTEIAEDIGPDEPFVVFVHFRHDAERVHAALERVGVSVSRLDGSHHELETWQAGETQALVTNIMAGSVGVDFTRAAICVYYSLNFRLLDYEQSRARVHRPGQERQVTYINLIARDSIDEKVHETFAERREIIQDALGLPPEELFG